MLNLGHRRNGDTTGPLEQWKKVAWSDESRFNFYIMWTAGYMFAIYLWNRWHQDALWEEDKPVEGV